MTDIVPIREAFRLGYEIVSDSECNAWYLKDGKSVGPYKRLEDAAYAALAEFEVEEAFRRYNDTEDA